MKGVFPVILMVGIALAMSVDAQVEADLDSQIRAVFDRASAAPEDPTVLTAALAEVDAILAGQPQHPLAHYVRGWILSRLSRPDEAVAAYDQALALAPQFADAAYNAGVVLADLGRVEEAIQHWDQAEAADPTSVDAIYNAGQALYSLGRYAEALERWGRARALVPDDFEIVKKVLQAYNALGQWAEAAATREDLLRIWRTSPDPRIRGMQAVVIDQFPVGDEWVLVYEALQPTGDLYWVYAFDCTRNQSQVVRSVRLESSAIIRELGTPYVVGVEETDRHSTLPIMYETLPDYPTLRAAMIDVIGRLQRGEDLGGASSTVD